MVNHQPTPRPEPPQSSLPAEPEGARPPLTPAAQRALAEAEARRRQRDEAAPAPAEVGGRQGPDPVRYGDWETGGIVSDF